MLPTTNGLDKNNSGQTSLTKLPSITKNGPNQESAKILEIIPDNHPKEQDQLNHMSM